MLQFRVFRNFYQCDECPNEFEDIMLTKGSSFCPCCDKEVDPYSSEEFLEEAFDDEEVE